MRAPLRPLPQILQTQAEGRDPNGIERAQVQARRAKAGQSLAVNTHLRMVFLSLAFVTMFAATATRVVTLSAAPAEEPTAQATVARIMASRADIIDRGGRILATNLETHALYAHPHQLIDPVETALHLSQIFPDIDPVQQVRRFEENPNFVWIKRTISPEEMQAVHDIGEPGLHFAPREIRLYPNGRLASHILGGTVVGAQDTHAAEIKGIAGIERTYDLLLRDPGRADPLQLSLDLTVQAALEQVLAGGMRLMNAKGAAAVVMDVHTGEVVAMASLPDFDPNRRPTSFDGPASDNPVFNRAVQGVYELGSVLKTLCHCPGLGFGAGQPADDDRHPWAV